VQAVVLQRARNTGCCTNDSCAHDLKPASAQALALSAVTGRLSNATPRLESHSRMHAAGTCLEVPDDVAGGDGAEAGEDDLQVLLGRHLYCSSWRLTAAPGNSSVCRPICTVQCAAGASRLPHRACTLRYGIQPQTLHREPCRTGLSLQTNSMLVGGLLSASGRSPIISSTTALQHAAGALRPWFRCCATRQGYDAVCGTPLAGAATVSSPATLPSSPAADVRHLVYHLIGVR
jgi:hypothetical protein